MIRRRRKAGMREALDDDGQLIGQIAVPVQKMVPLHAIDDRLVWLLRRAGEEWGALGVALTAAQLTDPKAVISRLSQDPPS